MIRRTCEKCGYEIVTDRIDGASIDFCGQCSGEAPLGIDLGPAIPGPLGAVDAYVLEERLGAGAEGEVWKARDGDRVVAVKIFRGPGPADRIRWEARKLFALAHPHIVPLIALRAAAGRAILVMERIDGVPIDRARLSPLQAIAAIVQCCEALHYAHARGVIHGDVKPSNVIVDGRKCAYLTDFAHPGIAGSPDFRAPEQIRTGPNVRTDVYGLGATLRAVLPEPRPPAIRQATAPDPADRFATAMEFAEALA